MNRLRFVLAMLSLPFLASKNGFTASLQISPVSVDIPAPALTTTVTLRNLDPAPITAQMRIFKWTQIDGKDVLQPTQDVVASPPSESLENGKPYTIRIVRLSHAPVIAEESYRLIIDQTSNFDPNDVAGVNLSIRYSIPVFFSRSSTAPKIVWKASMLGDEILLTGQNLGQKRMRISDLIVQGANGSTASLGNGLAGYILRKASMQFKLSATTIDFASSPVLVLKFQRDNYLTQVVAPIDRRN